MYVIHILSYCYLDFSEENQLVSLTDREIDQIVDDVYQLSNPLNLADLFLTLTLNSNN